MVPGRLQLWGGPSCLNKVFGVFFWPPGSVSATALVAAPLQSWLKTKKNFPPRSFSSLTRALGRHRFSFTEIMRWGVSSLVCSWKAGEKFQNQKCLFIVGLQMVKHLKNYVCVFMCMYTCIQGFFMMHIPIFGFDSCVRSHTQPVSNALSHLCEFHSLFIICIHCMHHLTESNG